ncbi:MAG: hypothetical protein U0M78_06330, partial [Sellimonas sp.]|nr:hypothetical protein [Sellimonas sp.]
YYEVYSLQRTEEVPEDYKEISFVCLRADGAYEAPSTVGIMCRAAKKNGYTGALKAPVRCFGNHLSEKRKSLFQTDNKCGGAAILKNRTSRMGTPVGC